MKAQGLWKENNAGGFFVPKTVLAGGGNSLLEKDVCQQVNKEKDKPSSKGEASL